FQHGPPVRYRSSSSLRPISCFLTATAPTEISTLSLHDALPIFDDAVVDAARDLLTGRRFLELDGAYGAGLTAIEAGSDETAQEEDRKSTRLNSSHSQISYAVFCLKKKTSTLPAAAGRVQEDGAR